MMTANSPCVDTAVGAGSPWVHPNRAGHRPQARHRAQHRAQHRPSAGQGTLAELPTEIPGNRRWEHYGRRPRLAHSSDKAVPVLRHFPNGRTARTRIALGALVCASMVAVSFAAPGPSLASGDNRHSLTHQKTQLGHQIASSEADLGEISQRLTTAQGALDSAAAELTTARTQLGALQVDVQQAVLRDQQMQQALDAARQRLADAHADLRVGLATVDRQRRELAGFAVSNAPAQLTQMSTLGLLFSANSTQQALARAQVARSALDTQVSQLQRLQANQVLLRYTEQRVADATAQVAADRAAAADHLARTQALESAASAAEATVAQQVVDLQSRRDALSAAKQVELHRIATMKQERDSLEARLRAIAARRAAARQSAVGANAVSAGGFLSLPLHSSTYVTSPYGMRLHPILHIWELHDGTDFHADCGTAVYAAAPGRVLSEYYNVGYGNRLLIDHGVVDGVSLATSYTHLSSYVAGVGSQVSRGQLIAYSGDTGWSTACHLHFSVYVNGSTVDPMTWL